MRRPAGLKYTKVQLPPGRPNRWEARNWKADKTSGKEKKFFYMLFILINFQFNLFIRAGKYQKKWNRNIRCRRLQLILYVKNGQKGKVKNYHNVLVFLFFFLTQYQVSKWCKMR